MKFILINPPKMNPITKTQDLGKTAQVLDFTIEFSFEGQNIVVSS
jgi:hypothetical protein